MGGGISLNFHSMKSKSTTTLANDQTPGCIRGEGGQDRC
ncbi:hypothetical protein COLO4_13988 [Corchorus olitorius]|uniref:Uncharacterized protein n=1 Tax=Corchorus olitorius TaxID=93759 RepID=A0A1R3JU75_9ROSI|nr:hypothetical protein COLO4_13988 [Corchorus olitorius]